MRRSTLPLGWKIKRFWTHWGCGTWFWSSMSSGGPRPLISVRASTTSTTVVPTVSMARTRTRIPRHTQIANCNSIEPEKGSTYITKSHLEWTEENLGNVVVRKEAKLVQTQKETLIYRFQNQPCKKDDAAQTSFFIIAWIVTSGKNLRNESSHSMNGRKVRSKCPTRIWSMHNIKEIAQQLICINSTLWGPNVCLTCKSMTNNTNRPSSIEAAKFLGLFQNFQHMFPRKGRIIIEQYSPRVEGIGSQPVWAPYIAWWWSNDPFSHSWGHSQYWCIMAKSKVLKNVKIVRTPLRECQVRIDRNRLLLGVENDLKFLNQWNIVAVTSQSSNQKAERCQNRITQNRVT